VARQQPFFFQVGDKAGGILLDLFTRNTVFTADVRGDGFQTVAIEQSPPDTSSDAVRREDSSAAYVEEHDAIVVQRRPGMWRNREPHFSFALWLLPRRAYFRFSFEKPMDSLHSSGPPSAGMNYLCW
jgi:hypothetical protein